MVVFTKLFEELLIYKIDCIIYIFGSYLNSENWADLDILIIYKNYDDVAIIKEILFYSLLDIPLDLNFMTKEEEKYFNFINKTNAKQIFPIEDS